MLFIHILLALFFKNGINVNEICCYLEHREAQALWPVSKRDGIALHRQECERRYAEQSNSSVSS